ncbi:unannotated protein [freshwater metagenome]|uniref:Unannotated protein n=1 Tax=freshwater metagenome TaxID=449393 RepID=A0A6J6RQD3_9ZZZZ
MRALESCALRGEHRGGSGGTERLVARRLTDGDRASRSKQLGRCGRIEFGDHRERDRQETAGLFRERSETTGEIQLGEAAERRVLAELDAGPDRNRDDRPAPGLAVAARGSLCENDERGERAGVGLDGQERGLRAGQRLGGRQRACVLPGLGIGKRSHAHRSQHRHEHERNDTHDRAKPRPPLAQHRGRSNRSHCEPPSAAR